MKWIFFDLIALLINILAFALNWKAENYGTACLNIFTMGFVLGVLIFVIKEEILDE